MMKGERRLFYLSHCVFPVLLALYPELSCYHAMPKKVFFWSHFVLVSVVSWLTGHAGGFYRLRKWTASLPAPNGGALFIAGDVRLGTQARQRDGGQTNSRLYHSLYTLCKPHLSLHPRSSSIAATVRPSYCARSPTRTLVPPSRFLRPQSNWVKGACPARPRPVRPRKL